MKIKNLVALAIFLAGTLCLHAQNSAPKGVVAAVQATEPAVTERGAHHKQWEWTTVDETGLPHKHAYQEIATGLNFQDDQTGEWRDSVEEIELFNGAAIFRKGQHNIIFPRDIADGQLDVLNPDQKRIGVGISGAKERHRGA